MIDYREELDFQIALVVFLVRNVGENKNGKKLLTIEKLRFLILICLTPKKLYSVISKLTNKDACCFEDVCYNDSSENISENDLKEISLLISYMCSSGYLKVVQDESRFIAIGEAASGVADSLCESMPNYLSRNVEILKNISRKSESLISKACMES
ncbi:hypothetical protein [Halovibrio sp. HP20-50]|uniref:hypothetical protein n=1 Tax=Halovibrio sp. HP20-59 TaxID=3080275 RepID=UPI00294B4AB5|nr:hypothetical protein [Halovibrio sp. HP20-59]MEA2120545.1 hypothetical protein [Halovibrio sp. HP20-59]